MDVSALAAVLDGPDPLTGAPRPSPWAQQKFNRIADALAQGLQQTVEFPGRAMQEGMTTGQAADWAAPMAMGMVGTPGVPGGAVGSGSSRWTTGSYALDKAELFKRLARENAERRGGSTARMFDSQGAIDRSRGLTADDLAADKAKYGWQASRNDALAEFRAAVDDALPAPKAAPMEPDPFGPRPYEYPALPGDYVPPRGLTAKEQVRLMHSLEDILKTYGLAGIPAAGVAGAAMDRLE